MDEPNISWGNFQTKEKRMLMIDRLVWWQEKKSIIDSVKKFMKDCEQSSLVVWFDSERDFGFCKTLSNDLYRNLVVLKIEYESSEGLYPNEYIYLWCKSEEIKETIRKNTYLKLLPYTQTVVRISEISAWEKSEIQRKMAIYTM